MSTEQTKIPILIVDDDLNFLEQFSSLLNSQGYSVLKANAATAALKILEQQPIAIIVSDQRMPEIQGSDLLSQVQAKYPSIVRLLITGYADLEAVVQAVNQGFIYQYIAKSLDPQEILQMIHLAVQKHQQDQKIRQLYLANQNQVQQLAAQSNLTIMGVFGQEVVEHLETTLQSLVGYIFSDAGTGDAQKVASDLQWIESSLNKIRKLGESTRHYKDEPAVQINIKEKIESELSQVSQLTQNIETKVKIDCPNIEINYPNKVFEQILKQLLENALLFNTKDNPKLNIHVEENEEVIKIKLSNPTLLTSDKQKENSQKLFAPFYSSLNFQSSSEIQEEYNLGPYNHFGLGLTWAQSLANLHHSYLVIKQEAALFTVEWKLLKS